ncbi:hypothetical protein HK100_010292 [Physocladia obscura]|uniref:Uncharacterized protein n=1 Tax=Physocladia obscura TaxID=109957 RepID=A0AAD5T2H4_9FUNG|nr:hypothetical protein HK100_010292 [Physocladia obscura]
MSYARIDEQQEQLNNNDNDINDFKSTATSVGATNILTSALRRALSPKPVEKAGTATVKTGTGTGLGPGSALMHEAFSDEEIWRPSPPQTPRKITAKMLLSGLDGSIDDDDWDDGLGSAKNAIVSDDHADDAEAAYFSYMKAKPRFKCHPKVWLWNNRKLIALVVVTMAAASVIVTLVDLRLRRFFPGGTVIPFQQSVILISIDGFREEYLGRGLTPNLVALGLYLLYQLFPNGTKTKGSAASGISASFMTPSFPSLTFPNHYSIVTGLYPESHGIVGNIFFDPTLNDTFVYVNPKSNGESKWWGGEPIWVTVIKAGLKSATCMWPGSEAVVHGRRPTYYQPYNSSMSNTDRVFQLLSWLSLPLESRPAFFTLYMNDVDSAGHQYGPTSAEVNFALKYVDDIIGDLTRGVLAVQGVPNLQAGKVNFVIVSDHGMAPGNPIENFIFLDDYVDESLFELVNNVVVSIYPKNSNDTQKIFQNLQDAAIASGHWHVWMRESVPSYFHYSNSNRIGPIVALPDEDYGLTLRSQFTIVQSLKPYKLGGMHGYNNTNINMRAIFVAAGPAFKSSGRVIDGSGSIWEETPDSELGVDGNGHIVAAHGGAAIGGFVSSTVKRQQGGKVAVFAGGVAKKNDGAHTIQENNGHSKKAGMSNEVGFGLPSDMAMQVLPGFQNVEVYNLIARVLAIPSNLWAPNNGSGSGMSLFDPWLNI